jgi:uncharacterized integral membrane protein (TIGR00698 family)
METKGEKRYVALGVDWSTLWKKEDWWAVWIGLFLVAMIIAEVVPIPGIRFPRFATWHGLDLPTVFRDGTAFIGHVVVLFLMTGVLLSIGAIVMGRFKPKFILAFLAIFTMAMCGFILARQGIMHEWGISFVLFCLLLGLIISNVFRVPQWLKSGSVFTEYFIKCGLVLMGAEILFWIVVEAGAVGVGQALLVVAGVWYFAYWLGRKVGMDKKFSSIMATGVSICGVSASIAAGGSVRGDPKHVTYVISWILVCAVVMVIAIPPLGHALNLPSTVAGAWIGSSIDNTGAVIAAGEVFGTEAALETAALVKMAQNVLIGMVAFLMAVWATLSLERVPGAKRPSAWEIWWRFPKFIVGFMIASLIVSFIVYPIWGAEGADNLDRLTTVLRNWFFAFAFVSIGLETRFIDLVRVGGGKPAIVYWVAQLCNVILSLAVAWLLWSGLFFTPPIVCPYHPVPFGR